MNMIREELNRKFLAYYSVHKTPVCKLPEYYRVYLGAFDQDTDHIAFYTYAEDVKEHQRLTDMLTENGFRERPGTLDGTVIYACRDSVEGAWFTVTSEWTVWMVKNRMKNGRDALKCTNELFREMAIWAI